MKCSKFQVVMVLFTGATLPPDLRGHLESCPACRAAFEQTEAVRKLVSLKKHEQPDAGFQERCVRAVSARIRELEARPESLSAWEWLTGFQPAFRYAAVAAVLALIALQHYSTSRIPALEPAVPEQRAASLAQEQVPTASTVKPVILFEAPPPQNLVFASNRTPESIQYGPVPSRLVGLEY